MLNGTEGVTQIAGPTILLRSGAYFDFEDPGARPVSITDVAWGLSNICRFTGHTKRFYSVAEHSYHCSFLVPPGFELAALLHDAAEAFIGDVSRPLKLLLPEYRVIEERIERAVLPMFALSYPLPPEVKMADARMLLAEQAQAMGNTDSWTELSGILAAEVDIQFWHPSLARAKFLERYYELREAAD